ncbi:calcium-binding protein [Cupriavidus sp. CV2]|uniref:calcium-binding protein n=1 Tax=Cupriavidus ulmosensis TaxID=3065913 RepID=UPI00296AC6E1|nr:calcium-binding protein [Cupriavidus sp. CV2]MDW3688599.1 calcium-binding protein [Cupriavidus sp. CV2]
MAKPGDNQHEQRISTEIVVDAYTEEECAMAWYCHLEDSLSFPFEARVRQAMAASPLRSGDRVSVLRLAHDQLCRVAIFVHALYSQRELVVPLAQLVPVRADKCTRLAVSDWHYWHDQGYSF